MVSARYIPDRGELVWLSFDPGPVGGQTGLRAALILSPAVYNDRVGLALVCPIAQAKGYPFEVLLPPGLAVTGAVLADQLKSVDWRARHADYAGVVPEGVLRDVAARLRPLIWIE